VGKSKGRNKGQKIETVAPSPIQFEIEENALELMEEHLALFKPRVKPADNKSRQESPKRDSNATIEIDLHGLTVDEAERWVIQVISRYPLASEKRTFKIITGKGRHSSSGRGVLIRELYLFVIHRYGPWIERIEESPDGVRLGGEAIRGHFHVTLKGP
jgi:DNA-nicking Smr family endonuclease